MRYLFFPGHAALTFLLGACAAPPTEVPDAAAIAAELVGMAADDQRLEQLVMDADPATVEPGFFDRKRALQRERTARCKEIFERHGFPAPPAFDARATSSFWLLVQHSDSDPTFQQRVLGAMAALPEGVVDAAERAFLVDRVRVNTGRLQVYGTQVDYDAGRARAFPEPLEDPASVDARRRSVGLDPLWQYMNSMSELHYAMNREAYEGRGVMAPWRYEPGHSAW